MVEKEFMGMLRGNCLGDYDRLTGNGGLSIGHMGDCGHWLLVGS